MNRLLRTTAIVCAVLPAVVKPAGATIETFAFSGTIKNVHDKSSLLGGIKKGIGFTGSYWIDTEKLKEIQNSLNQKNSYTYRLFEGDEDAIGMKVVIGEKVFASGSKQNSRITSYSNTHNESCTLYAYADTQSGNAIEYLALSFSGKKNALSLQTDPLLLDGVDLDDKNISATMTYLDYDRSNNGKSNTYGYSTGALGSHTHVGSSVTPEPGTMFLLILGGGVLMFRHKRRKQTVP